MSAPRQTQPVPKIVITPPDEERSIEKTRKPFFDSSQPVKTRPVGPRTIQPCPVSNQEVTRPRMTGGLSKPLATRPTERMTLPVFAKSLQAEHKVPQDAIAARFASLGDVRDVRRAVAELSERGAIIGELIMVRYVAMYKAERERNEQHWLDQKSRVTKGTYGIERLASPTAADTTKEAAQQRYEDDQQLWHDFIAELQSRAKNQ